MIVVHVVFMVISALLTAWGVGGLIDAIRLYDEESKRDKIIYSLVVIISASILFGILAYSLSRFL